MLKHQTFVLCGIVYVDWVYVWKWKSVWLCMYIERMYERERVWKIVYIVYVSECKAIMKTNCILLHVTVDFIVKP